MLLKPISKSLKARPSYFKLTPQLILAAIHDDIEDAVVHSVSRREKITLHIKFSLDNPEISSKRTSYAGKIIDLRTNHVAFSSKSKDAIADTVRRNVIRTLNLVGQMISEDLGLFNPEVFAELKITFSLGKATGIMVSRSKEFVNRNA